MENDLEARVITVSYDSGSYRKRMGLGPEFLLESGLKPLFSRLGVNVERADVVLSSSHPAEISAAFDGCRMVAERISPLLTEGVFPVVLSGNCITAVGAISGCGASKTGVVWFDAHGEGMTPETTGSGFLDGMGISVLTGQCWDKLAKKIPQFEPVKGSRILLVGARDLEEEERTLLDEVGVIRAKRAGEIETGIKEMDGIDGVYVHIDLDVLDPAAATANQWTAPGGLTVPELIECLRVITRSTAIKGVGIGSYDPESDANRKALAAACVAIETIWAGSR